MSDKEENLDPEHPVALWGCLAAFLIALMLAIGTASFYFKWWWGFLICFVLAGVTFEGLVIEAGELPEKLKEYRRKLWAKRGCCLKCGYDLRGSPKDGECPECGAACPVKKIRRAKRRHKNRQDNT